MVVIIAYGSNTEGLPMIIFLLGLGFCLVIIKRSWLISVKLKKKHKMHIKNTKSIQSTFLKRQLVCSNFIIIRTELFEYLKNPS